jgi:maltose O-acetyltransferase
LDESTSHLPDESSKLITLRRRVMRLAHEDILGFHLRLHIAELLSAFAPRGQAMKWRTTILRRAGFKIGTDTLIGQIPRINGARNLYGNLVIGNDCTIEVGCTLDLTDKIRIADRVTIGHQAMILTSSHELGPGGHRAGALTCAPVDVGDGAQIGARVIILPGVTIGSGVIVDPGSVVNRSVPSNSRVAGSPAKVVEQLSERPA